MGRTQLAYVLDQHKERQKRYDKKHNIIRVSISDVIKNPYLTMSNVRATMYLKNIIMEEKPMAVVYGYTRELAHIELTNKHIAILSTVKPDNIALQIKDIEYKIENGKFIITHCNIDFPELF